MVKKVISILLLLVFGIYINTLKTRDYIQGDIKVCQELGISAQHSLEKSTPNCNLYSGCGLADAGAEIFMPKSKRRYEEILFSVLSLTLQFKPAIAPVCKVYAFKSGAPVPEPCFNPHSLRGPPLVA